MIPIIIYLLGVVATVILLIFTAVKSDEIILLYLFLGIIISLTSWFGFMFVVLVKYGEVVIYKREKE